MRKQRFPQILFQTVSLLALITLFWFLLWKSNLDVIRRKAPRQSFSRSFGILGVLWKSLGAPMDQKLDNSPTFLQLLNLGTSSYPFKLNQNSIHSDVAAWKCSNFIDSPNFKTFNQDGPQHPRMTIKVFKLYFTILIYSETLFLWHFVVIFFSLE